MKVCAVEDDYSRHQEKEKRRLSDYFIKNYYDIMAELKQTGGLLE